MSNRSIQDQELINQIKSLPKDFLDELKNEVKQNRNIENRRKRFLTRIVPLVAACILTVISVSTFVELPNFSQKYVATNKIQNDIVLPDNSKISLDINTSVKVKYYKDKRIIKLSNGKAMFNVASNKEQPFIINTDRINVQVLGTKFEVVNLDEKLQVNVLEGTVRVSKSKENEKELAIVTKGQSLELDKNVNVLNQKNANIQKMIQWSEGKFTFHQTSLNEVLYEYSKYLDIKISFENEKSKVFPISGNFDVKHFDDFLNVLPMIHPITIVKKDNFITIK